MFDRDTVFGWMFSFTVKKKDFSMTANQTIIKKIVGQITVRYYTVPYGAPIIVMSRI